MKRRTILVGIIFCGFNCLITTPIFADEQGQAPSIGTQSKNEVTFQVDHSVAVYESRVTKSSQNTSASTDLDSTTVETFPPDLSICIGINKWRAYAVPLSSGSSFKLGYAFIDELELGLGVGLNEENGGSEDKTTQNYGLYAVYVVAQPILNIEISADLSQSIQKVDTHDAA